MGACSSVPPQPPACDNIGKESGSNGVRDAKFYDCGEKVKIIKT